MRRARTSVSGLAGRLARLPRRAALISVAVTALVVVGAGVALSGGDGTTASAGDEAARAERILAVPPPRARVTEPDAGREGALPILGSSDADSEPGLGSQSDDENEPHVSPGAPSDAQIAQDLEDLERENERIESLLFGLDGGSGGSGTLLTPVRGTLTSPFGPRWGRLHAGIDIAAPTGSPIRAAQSGRVAIAGPYGGYGNFTCILHSRSVSTCYGHQSQQFVARGDAVERGQVIGLVGCTGSCTGPHLHFEVRVNGRARNPLPYL